VVSTGNGPGHIKKEEKLMQRFIIERETEGASQLTTEQLAEMARTSNAAVDSLGVEYTWVTS
jgi:hypothetical protein